MEVVRFGVGEASVEERDGEEEEEGRDDGADVNTVTGSVGPSRPNASQHFGSVLGLRGLGVIGRGQRREIGRAHV